jgi:hypothetical protein
MALTALSNPSAFINGINVQFKPNTIAYSDGLGEQKIRSQSGGGGTSQTVFSIDAETRYSVVKGNLYPTPENLEFVRGWKSLGNANTITLSDESGFSRTFTFCAMINEPSITLGADSDFEVEFHGEPAV